MSKPIAAIAFCVTAAVSTVPADASTYTSYYAFGDSLTDDGKLGLPLPYAGGRFSTGPTWAEYIAEFFSAAGLSTANLALGGATAGDTNTNDYPDAAQPFATFNSQISTFTPLGNSGATGSNPLISVLLGANDIFQGGDPVAAAMAVGAGLKRLTELGEKFDDFLVSTLPGLGGGDADPAIAFNIELEKQLVDLEAGGANIIRVDQAVYQAGLFPRLGELGITNLDGPCVVEPTADSPGSDCTIIGFEDDGTPIRDLSIADTYYLIDSVHPTGPVQRAFGEFAIDLIEEDLPAPIPLPAGLPLLVVGLGAFAWMRRRQAA